MLPDWRWGHLLTACNSEDKVKNEDDLKNGDDLNNEDILKNEDDVNCWWLLSLTGTAKLTQNQKCHQLTKLEIEFDGRKEINTALGMHTCSEKITF